MTTESLKMLDELKKVDTTPVNLGFGSQVINVSNKSPFNFQSIKGRTLINLLGKDGNCESLVGYFTYQSTLTTIPALTHGVNALEATSTVANFASFGSNNTYTFKQNKCYVSIAAVKGSSGISGGIDFPGVATYEFLMTGQVQIIGKRIKYPPSDINVVFAPFIRATAIGQKIAADGVRLYEITQAEYDVLPEAFTIDSTNQWITDKYPYVDDMKSIINPYIIKSGDNLLPPLNENSEIRSTAFVSKPYTLSTRTGDNVDFSNFNFTVVPNTNYTLSATLVNAYHAIFALDFSTSIVSYSTNGSMTFNSGNHTKLAYVVKSINTTNESIVSDPMLNFGSVALPFKPKNDDYIYFPDVKLASNTDGSVYDTLFKRDGKYWKLSTMRSLELTGDLSWSYGGVSASGWKALSISIAQPHAQLDIRAVKYNGKILEPYLGTFAPDMVYYAGAGAVYLSVPNSESGWGDGYSPSATDIQAYFYGWKISSTNTLSPAPYTGTGNKYWYAIGAVPLDSNWYTFANAAPKTSPTGFKPYKLQYRIATPTIEEVAVEGDITFHQGLNQIEVGNGIVVREKVNLQGHVGNYYVNGSGEPLKYKVAQFKGVYKNGKESQLWITDYADVVGYYKYTNAANVDLTDSYTTTYIPLEQCGLTSNLLSVQGEYSSNARTVAETLIINQADVATRIGTLENTKQQVSQWITPTLINGWTHYGGSYPNVSFTKDDSGLISFRGLATSPVSPDGTKIFILPKEYRTKNSTTFLINSGISSVAGEIHARIAINPDGSVYFINGGGFNTVGGAGWINLNNISYLIE